MQVGQDIAKAIRAAYGVPRVAFLFTGGDLNHTHTHGGPGISCTILNGPHSRTLSMTDWNISNDNAPFNFLPLMMKLGVEAMEYSSFASIRCCKT